MTNEHLQENKQELAEQQGQHSSYFLSSVHTEMRGELAASHIRNLKGSVSSPLILLFESFQGGQNKAFCHETRLHYSPRHLNCTNKCFVFPQKMCISVNEVSPSTLKLVLLSGTGPTVSLSTSLMKMTIMVHQSLLKFFMTSKRSVIINEPLEVKKVIEKDCCLQGRLRNHLLELISYSFQYQNSSQAFQG